MKQFDRITPDGTKDRLFGECEAKEAIAARLRTLFEASGFREVSTPLLEYYDVFDTTRSYFPQESIYKLIDRSGRILVLRPDCTIPIARMAGSRLRGESTVRLYYSQNIYRHSDMSSGAAGEIAQMGVEYIGGGLPICDIEMVRLAAQCLHAACGDDFQLELCHIGYFNALVDSLETDDARREEIRELVEHKNFPALDRLLDRFEGAPAQKALRRLPALFGPADVLDEARALFSSPAADRSLDLLARIYHALEQLGLGDRLTIDLGLVNQADYYTGIIFRGYTAGAGEPVLAGGRYDGLLGEFGPSRPATGFGINLDLLCESMTGTAVRSRERIAVAVDAESNVKAVFSLLEALRGQGMAAQMVQVERLDTLCPLEGFAMTYAVERDLVREVAR